MSAPTHPYKITNPENIDASHLSLLSAFHYVLAGLSLLCLGGLFLHYHIMKLVTQNPKTLPPAPFDMQEFFDIFLLFYILAGIYLLLITILNLLSARFIANRKHRTFSLIVSGMNCVQFPLGTILGIFTFIVLFRISIRNSYLSTLNKTSA